MNNTLPSPVRPGEPVTALWANQMRNAVQANTLQAVVGGTFTRNGNGTTINVRKTSRGNAGSTATVEYDPFTAFIRESTTTPGDYQIGILKESYIFDDLNPTTAITISNLLNNTVSTATAGWIPAKASGEDKVWIKGPVVGLTCTSGVVESLGNGDTFDGGVVEHNDGTPPTQTYFRRIIATINCDASPPVVSRQFVRDHMTLMHIAYDGALNASATSGALIAAVFPVTE